MSKHNYEGSHQRIVVFVIHFATILFSMYLFHLNITMLTILLIDMT